MSCKTNRIIIIIPNAIKIVTYLNAIVAPVSGPGAGNQNGHLSLQTLSRNSSRDIHTHLSQYLVSRLYLTR